MNKKQQIIEFLDADNPSETKANPADYHFWREEDGLQITFSNWGEVLRGGRHREMLSIRLQKYVPKLAVLGLTGSHPPSESSVQKRNNSPSDFQVSAVEPPAFLEWKMLDEFGNEEKSSRADRIAKFLRAIHLKLPVQVELTLRERSKRPQDMSERHANEAEILSIRQFTYDELYSHLESSKIGLLGGRLLEKTKVLLSMYLPKDVANGITFETIRLLWGAVFKFLQVRFHGRKCSKTNLRVCRGLRMTGGFWTSWRYSWG